MVTCFTERKKRKTRLAREIVNRLLINSTWKLREHTWIRESSRKVQRMFFVYEKWIYHEILKIYLIANYTLRLHKIIHYSIRDLRLQNDINYGVTVKRHASEIHGTMLRQVSNDMYCVVIREVHHPQSQIPAIIIIMAKTKCDICHVLINLSVYPLDISFLN